VCDCAVWYVWIQKILLFCWGLLEGSDTKECMTYIEDSIYKQVSKEGTTFENMKSGEHDASIHSSFFVHVPKTNVVLVEILYMYMHYQTESEFSECYQRLRFWISQYIFIYMYMHVRLLYVSFYGWRCDASVLQLPLLGSLRLLCLLSLAQDGLPSREYKTLKTDFLHVRVNWNWIELNWIDF
jgi:hypothetical protein